MADGFTFSLLIAAFGGLLSFLSPCVLPLVPGYLCFAAGMEFEELAEADKQTVYARVLPTALAFVLGFSVVFISLGAGAAAINPLILGHKEILGKIAGVFIIALGLHMTGIIRFSFLQKELRVNARVETGDSKIRQWQLMAAFGLGLAFAFGWTPCIGPILATILTLAASSDSLTQGTVLLTAYALGLGVPFILTSLGVSHFLQTSARLKQNMRTIEISTGILLAATGILIYLGSLQGLASHLLDWMPFLAKLG
ncbi:MAG: cytochrome c biogenesis CcdA family protein [Parvibaculales bacterium]